MIVFVAGVVTGALVVMVVMVIVGVVKTEQRARDPRDWE